MNDSTVNKQTLEEVYEKSFEKLYKFFYYKVQSSHISEDLTSDTFLAFTNSLKANKEIQNINAFLFGIARNVFTKYLQQKYKQEIPFSNISDNFEDYVDNYIVEIKRTPSLDEKVKKFMDKVPEKQRIVLELRFFQKLSLKEICEKLNKDMNYVKTTQKRGIRSLKDIIALEFG